MALYLGSSLVRGGLFELNEYEAAFHPWWDSLQDYIMYTSIIVGLFSFPTANTEAECALIFPNNTSPASASFVNGFCTREVVPLFISYFPYLVFLGPTLLVILELFFTKATAVGVKMQHFYRLLVDTNKRRQNFNATLDQREAMEIHNVYFMSSSFYWTYAFKNLLQFLIAIIFVVLMFIFSNGNIFSCDRSGCNFVTYWPCKLTSFEYTCLVSNTDFYFYILVTVGALLLIYILANFYTLLWISIRPFRKLGRFLKHYKKGVRNYFREKESVIDADSILDVYGGIRSLDVEILLDLLAEKLGIEMALKILTVLDKEFNQDWKPQPREQSASNFTSDKLTIEFQEPLITRYIGSTFLSQTIFTAQLESSAGSSSSRTIETQSQAFVYDKSPKNVKVENDRVFSQRSPDFFETTFENLYPGENYKIRLSTFLNGTLMGETFQMLTTKPSPPENFSYRWKFDFSEPDVRFKVEITWSPGQSSLKGSKYLVEVENSSGISSEVTHGEHFSMVLSSTETMKIKIWSTSDPLGASNPLNSETPLEGVIDPAPEAMTSLADHLKQHQPSSHLSSYSYRLALLSQVTKELKDLYEEIQRTATNSNQLKLENSEDAVFSPPGM